MDKFAVVLQADGGERLIENHNILKRLPKKVAKEFLPYLSAQKTGLILDKENQEDLGYLIDLPGFFLNWQPKDDDDGLKQVRKLAGSLEKWNCPILGFPLFYNYLNETEYKILENTGIILLDGFDHILAGLLLAVKQLLRIVKKDVPRFEIGVWGADTDIGQVWVEALAADVNQMCIGGHNYMELEVLAEYILKSTGLSCQITTKPQLCLGNKDITIVADVMDITINNAQACFHVNSLPGYKYRNPWHPIEMGWMNLPNELKVDLELNPYEQLGVMAGLFYSISSYYREYILKGKITLERMTHLHYLYKLLNLKPQGFVQDGQRIHFDRFRREYFGENRLDKSDDYNYNTFN